MIIVKVTGGLGNQLFQYALARQLAENNQSELVLFTGFYHASPRDGSGVTKREFLLPLFNIAPCEQVGNPGSLARLHRSAGLRAVSEEMKFIFQPSILRLTGNICLSGYWQNEKYFASIANAIRSEFTLRYGLSEDSERIAAIIRRSATSVALHVRRGDYVTNEDLYQRYGICSLSYYHHAIACLEQTLGTLSLFVFSDDPTWAREHCAFSHPTIFVDHKGSEKAHEDLWLMSLCEHAIIANSSFSWWGAWLNGNPDKIVYAPAPWFNVPAEANNIVPDGWLTLPKS